VQPSYVSTSHNHLKELGDALAGEWTGVVTLSADEPPAGKKGDKLEGHTHVEWILNGAALEMTYRIGTTAGKAIIAWDSGSNQIVSHLVSEAGVGHRVYSKQGGKWIVEASGANGEGKKDSSRIEITIQDDGKTHVYHYSHNAQDVWRRKS
jgi:hypothetical protein